MDNEAANPQEDCGRTGRADAPETTDGPDGWTGRIGQTEKADGRRTGRPDGPGGPEGRTGQDGQIGRTDRTDKAAPEIPALNTEGRRIREEDRKDGPKTDTWRQVVEAGGNWKRGGMVAKIFSSIHKKGSAKATAVFVFGAWPAPGLFA